MKLVNDWSHVAAGVTFCGSVPATPDYCSVILPNGQFVGGIECGNTVENKVIAGLHGPIRKSFLDCTNCA